MGKQTHLMIHCADTPAGVPFDADDIRRWHTDQPPAGRGWSRPGYSGGWKLDGTLEILLPFNNDEIVDPWELSNGAAGWNGLTKHFYYIGGKDNTDTRTPEQRAAMASFAKMAVIMWPGIKLIGHNQVNQHKYCPSFDVPCWAHSIGIPDTNIDYKTYY